MSRLDVWWNEVPQRSPADYATELARDRFWRDEQRRLLVTHPDFPDVAMLLDNLGEELAHGLLLILSRLPEDRRRSFAEVFFEECRGGRDELPHDAGRRVEAAAAVALLVLRSANPSFVPDRPWLVPLIASAPP